MTIKTIFVANDGKEFSTEAECTRYENSQDRQRIEEAAFLNRVCKFFNAEGEQIVLNTEFKEEDIYGVVIYCSMDEVHDVRTTFGNHFDSLYYALEASSFGSNCSEVVLAYKWFGEYSNWCEIEYDEREWYSFIKKVLEWA